MTLLADQPATTTWSYVSHDHAESRAYQWREDGITWFSADHHRVRVAIAEWSGVDPILTDRMFGLTNGEGNEGDDVKERYLYPDVTPTSSYRKYRANLDHGGTSQ